MDWICIVLATVDGTKKIADRLPTEKRAVDKGCAVPLKLHGERGVIDKLLIVGAVCERKERHLRDAGDVRISESIHAHILNFDVASESRNDGGKNDWIDNEGL